MSKHLRWKNTDAVRDTQEALLPEKFHFRNSRWLLAAAGSSAEKLKKC